MSAELHVFGQLVGFQLLQSQSSPFADHQYFVHFVIEHGPAWQVLAGQSCGLTASSDGVWSHPLDLHLACDSIQGWPRLRFQVFRERLSVSPASNGPSSASSRSLAWWSDSTIGAISSLCTPYAQGVCYLPARPGQQTLIVALTQNTSLNDRNLLPAASVDHPLLDSSGAYNGVAAVSASLDPPSSSGASQPDKTIIDSLSGDKSNQSPFDYELESRMLIRLDLFVINRNFRRFGVYTH